MTALWLKKSIIRTSNGLLIRSISDWWLCRSVTHFILVVVRVVFFVLLRGQNLDWLTLFLLIFKEVDVSRSCKNAWSFLLLILPWLGSVHWCRWIYLNLMSLIYLFLCRQSQGFWLIWRCTQSFHWLIAAMTSLRMVATCLLWISVGYLVPSSPRCFWSWLRCGPCILGTVGRKLVLFLLKWNVCCWFSYFKCRHLSLWI